MAENYATDKYLLLGGYLSVVITAELLIAFNQAVIGLICCYILLAAVFIQVVRCQLSAQAGDVLSPDKKVLVSSAHFYFALMLVPLIRILGLPITVSGLPMGYQLILVGVPVISAVLIIISLAGYRPRDIFLSIFSPVLFFLLLLMIIGLTGIPLGLLEEKILTERPLLFTSSFRYRELFLVLILVSGFLEELIFRGVLLKAAGDYLGKTAGPIYVSLLFAALQITHLLFLEVVFSFLVGLFFCWVVQRTGSIWGVTVAHGLMHFILYYNV
jgi:membrane protease YdiL (CAAX protease family)